MLASYLIYPPSKDDLARFEKEFLKAFLSSNTLSETTNITKSILKEKNDYFLLLKYAIRYLELMESQNLESILKLLTNTVAPPELTEFHQVLTSYVKASLYYLDNEFQKSIQIIHELNNENFDTLTAYPELFTELDLLLLNNYLRLNKSKESFELATKIIERIDEKLHWRRVYALSRLGNTYYLNNNYTVAKKIFSQAMQLKDFDDPLYDIMLNNNIGVCSYQIGDLKEAKKYLTKSYQILEENNVQNYNLLGLTSQNLGEIYLFENNYELSEKYLTQSRFYLKKESPNFNPFLSDTDVMLLEIAAIRHLHDKINELLKEIEEISMHSDIPSMKNNLEIAYMLTDIAQGNLYSAHKRYDNLKSINEIQEPINVLAWRIRSFLSIFLYSFTRDKTYLEDAKKNLSLVFESAVVKENLVVNVQHLYLRMLINLYEHEKIEPENINEIKQQINILPSQLRDRYETLVKFMKMGSSFTLPLTLTDIFQISYPSNVYARIKVMHPFKEVIEEIALYKVSDLGPEIVYASGKIKDSYLIERLGTFSIILIGTGDRYPEGFWGPLPTSQPEYNALILSRIVKDQTSKDNRRKGWVFSVLNFYYKSTITLSEQEVALIEKKGELLFRKITDISQLSKKEWLKWLKDEFEFLEAHHYEH